MYHNGRLTMKKISIYFILATVLLVIVLEGCLLRRRNGMAATGTPPIEVTHEFTQSTAMESHLDVQYKSLPGVNPKYLSLDIYGPQDGSVLPVMIFVHGGAWSLGDKSQVDLKPDFFVQSGFVFVSVNYRLSPAYPFPAQAEDVASAVAWVHNNIANYGGDPAKMILMGHSAGAHLVALVATDAQFLQAEGSGLNVLKAVIPLDTQAYDLTEVIGDSPQETKIYTGVFGTDPSGWKSASPVNYISAGKGIPPMAVAYSGGLMGEGDYTRQQAAEEFTTRLQEAGIEYVLVPAPEKTHAQINQEFGQPGDRVTNSVMEFILRILAINN
jgi:arylformamidase